MRGVQPVGGIRRYRELQLLLHVRVLSAHPRVARSRAKGRAAALHGDCSRVPPRFHILKHTQGEPCGLSRIFKVQHCRSGKPFFAGE